MSSNLKVNTILPSTGTTIGIGTVGGLINIVGNIDVNSTSGISTFNGLEISGIVTAKAGAAVTYYGDGSNLTGLPAETTINNRADNRVLTATGSANVLNAESNVHIDGSGRLMIGTTTEGNESADELTVASSGNTGITIRSGASSNASLFFSDATSGADEYRGFVQYIQSNDDLKFGTATLERLRIQSNGDVYLNATVGSTAVNSGAIRRFNAGLDYWSGTSGSANAIKYAVHGAGDDNMYGMGISASLLEIQSQVDIGFFCGGAGGGTGRRVERFRMKSTGDLQISDGNLVIGTSGHGIDFSATADAPLTGASMSNELLDDYEEGSFTPSGFCDGGSVNVISATYTKIGRVVNIYFYVDSINIPNTACQWKLYGLPFTVNSTNHYPALTIGYVGNANLPAEIRFLCRTNTNWIYSHTTASSASSLTNQGMRAYIQGHSLLISGFYYTD